MRTPFYNIFIDNYNTNEFITEIKIHLNSESPIKSVNFMNAHCFNVAQKNTEYFKALHNSDYLLNDGIGIKIAGKLKKISFKENMNGTDLIPKIFELCITHSFSIFFLGGKPGVAKKAMQNVKVKFPGISIAGINDGYFPMNECENIIRKINKSNADVLIVGMGVPHQEIWLAKYKESLIGVKLGIAAGAVFDFQSNKVKRAPIWMQKIGLEWFYRFMQEPNRLFKRYFIGNIIFFANIFKLRNYTANG